MRKEEDLKDAEAKIERLQKHLKALEGMLEASSKKIVPVRNQDDSPELHVVKRSKLEKVKENVTACTCRLESYKARGEIDNVKESSRKKLIIASAPPSLVVIKSERPKSTSPPSHHEDQPRGRELVAEGLDSMTQWRFQNLRSDRGGPDMRNIDPEPELWLDYNKPGSTHTDFEVVKMAVFAWRHRLRKNQEYLSDRRLPDQVHLDHVKILAAALRDFKCRRLEKNMGWVRS
jgi:hypothetical protein